MRRLDAFGEFPAVAHHPVKYASFRQTTLAGGFAPVAKSNAKHTDLFALGDDLSLSLWSQRLLVLAVICPAHVQTNREACLEQNATGRHMTITLNLHPLMMTGTIGGMQIETSPRLCQAVLTDRFDGVLTVTLSTDTTAGQLTVSLGHCLTGAQGSGEVFPMTLELPSPGCRFGSDLAVLDGSGARSVPASRGRFQIDSAAFVRGARLLLDSIDISEL